MPALARKFVRPPTRDQSGPVPQRKIFHAAMLVTRLEQWFVVAENAEEAHALLAAGEGHSCALGERVHVEVERVSEGAE